MANHFKLTLSVTLACSLGSAQVMLLLSAEEMRGVENAATSELRFCLHEEKAYQLVYPLKGYQGIMGLPYGVFPVLYF